MLELIFSYMLKKNYQGYDSHFFVWPTNYTHRSFPAIWWGKKVPLSKLNAVTRLTITSKWSITMMEIFLSLDKYPALCELKLLGAS